MKTQLSALDLFYLTKELQQLVEGKIDKIYQPEKEEFLIQIYARETGKVILRIKLPGIVVIELEKSPTEAPSGFCMQLRKHLEGSRIRSIEQLGFERILKINLETKETKYELIIELFNKGNLILVREGKIIALLNQLERKDRSLKTNIAYVAPTMAYALPELDFTAWKNLLALTEKEQIVKCLVADLGLGGIYAEEACFVAELDKKKSPKALTQHEQKNLLQAAQALLHRSLDPVLYENEAFPFLLHSYPKEKQIKQATFNEAIKALVKAIPQQLKSSPHQKEIERVKTILSAQQQQIKTWEKEAEEQKRKGEMIYEHYQELQQILQVMREAIKKYSEQELKEKLKQQSKIKKIDLKEKEVVVSV
ncbi:NFACT family protein [Candidatus Woesearchaeota archaeon]|nr:NFACT family protein [Candidatus Woesearchaeota archaeon]